MKNKVINILLKWGNNEESVLSMIDKNFDFAVSTYRDATPSFIANIVSTLR